jgi:hypothetical protein
MSESSPECTVEKQVMKNFMTAAPNTLVFCTSLRYHKSESATEIGENETTGRP